MSYPTTNSQNAAVKVFVQKLEEPGETCIAPEVDGFAGVGFISALVETLVAIRPQRPLDALQDVHEGAALVELAMRLRSLCLPLFRASKDLQPGAASSSLGLPPHLYQVSCIS